MRLVLYLTFGFLILGGCQARSSAPKDGTQPASPQAAGRQVAETHTERGPVKVTVEVAPTPLRLSDEPTLTLTIAAQRGVVVERPPFGDAVGDFLIRDFREPLPEVQGDLEITRLVYTLEPTISGPAQIDPLVVRFTDSRPQGDGKQHTVETESLTIQVLSSVGKEAPSLADLKTYDRPVPLPSAGTGGWLVGLGLVIAAVLGALWRRRKKLVAVQAVQLTPREQANRELEQLWRSGTAQRDVKGFYVELTGIVRRYIERTTDIQAPEQTTEEFLREIGRGTVFSRDERQKLGEFLEAADLVKFAKHHPAAGDVDESYRRARTFVGLETTEVAV